MFVYSRLTLPQSLYLSGFCMHSLNLSSSYLPLKRGFPFSSQIKPQHSYSARNIRLYAYSIFVSADLTIVSMPSPVVLDGNSAHPCLCALVKVLAAVIYAFCPAGGLADAEVSGELFVWVICPAESAYFSVHSALLRNNGKKPLELIRAFAAQANIGQCLFAETEADLLHVWLVHRRFATCCTSEARSSEGYIRYACYFSYFQHFYFLLLEKEVGHTGFRACCRIGPEALSAPNLL